MKDFNKSFENATSLHKQGKINEALEIYLELQKEDNNNSQLLFQIGNAYLQKGSVELSINFYRKVSEIDKDHFNNLNNLGGALATIGKYAEAIDVFKKTLNIKPDYSDAYSNIGNCYLYIKNHKNSIENFKKAIDLNKENSFAFNGLGSVYKELDDNDNAIINYKKAVKIKPDYFIAYYNLGTTLSTIRNFEEAKQAFERVLELKPDHNYTIGKLIHTNMMLSDWTNLDTNLNNMISSINAKKKVIDPFPVLSLIDDPLYNEAIKSIQDAGGIIIEFTPPKIDFKGFRKILDVEMKREIPKYLSQYSKLKNEIMNIKDIMNFNLDDSLNRSPYGQTLFEGIMNDKTKEEDFEKLKNRIMSEGKRYFNESIEKYSLDAILSINNYHAAYAAAAHYPCLTVPMGYKNSGLPANLTFIGPSMSENKLYQYGFSYEKLTKKRIPPKL